MNRSPEPPTAVDARLVAMLFVASLALVPSSAVSAEAPPKGAFLEQVSAHFAEWDRDGNGALSPDEIELAVNNREVKGPAAAAAVALRRAIRADRSIESFTVERISHAVREPGEAKIKPLKLETMYEHAMKRITDAKRDLFVSGKPSIAALAQGRLGDCFLLAGLGTVAHLDPDRLVRIIQPKADGMIEVAFANGYNVAVRAPTDGELCLGASTGNDGVWAIAFEKAVGDVFLQKQTTPRHVTPLSIIGVGGTPNRVPELITGHRVQRVGCEAFQKAGLSEAERNTKLDEMRAILIATQKAGRIIVGGTAPIGKQTIVPGLYYNHSYGVLNYDAARDEVLFWNPMGNGFTPKGPAGLSNGYPTSHGQFLCPLTDAVMWFGSFSVETDEPLPQ